MKTCPQSRGWSVVALLLIAAIFQFFVPVFNAVAALPCCDSEEMQCCQDTYPARMVCCVGDGEHGADDAAPAQVIQGAPQRWSVIPAPAQIDISPALPSQPGVRVHRLPSFFQPANPRLHQKLCVFLI